MRTRLLEFQRPPLSFIAGCGEEAGERIGGGGGRSAGGCRRGSGRGGGVCYGAACQQHEELCFCFLVRFVGRLYAVLYAAAEAGYDNIALAGVRSHAHVPHTRCDGCDRAILCLSAGGMLEDWPP